MATLSFASSHAPNRPLSPLTRQKINYKCIKNVCPPPLSVFRLAFWILPIFNRFWNSVVEMPVAASKRRIQQIPAKNVGKNNNSEYREYKPRWQQIFSPLLHNSKVFTSFSWQSHLKMFGICQHAPMNK